MDKYRLLVEGILRGKNKEYTGSIGYLVKYFTPRKDPRSFNHVKLRPLTLVGFMEMGKTETAKYLINLSQEYCEKQGIGYLSLTGKSIVDIMYYIRDNKDLLKNVNIIHIFVDDLFYGGLSTEKSRGKRLGEKIYSDIRHWPERMGVRSGIIYVLFSAQRFSLIPVFFRNTPFILFKGMSIQDKYEKQVIREVLATSNERYDEKLADILIEILQTITYMAYVEYRDDVKALTIVKPLRGKPYIYVQPGLADPDLIEIPFNYSGVFEEDTDTGSTVSSEKELEQMLKYIVRRLKRLRKQRIIVVDRDYLTIRIDGKRILLFKKEIGEKLGII